METIKYFQLEPKHHDCRQIIPWGIPYCIYYHQKSNTCIVALDINEELYQVAERNLLNTGAKPTIQPVKGKYVSPHRLMWSNFIAAGSEFPFLFYKYYPNLVDLSKC